MNCKVARTLGLGCQFGGRELAGLAVEPRHVNAFAFAVAKPRKGGGVSAPVGEVLFTGGRDARCQKCCRSGSAEKCASSHGSFEGHALPLELLHSIRERPRRAPAFRRCGGEPSWPSSWWASLKTPRVSPGGGWNSIYGVGTGQRGSKPHGSPPDRSANQDQALVPPVLRT